MLFLKEHLVNNNYEWPNPEKYADVNKAPGRLPFDRMNGDQVLFIINYFCQAVDKVGVNEGQKIEQLIIDQLPLSARSELAVFNWLRNLYLY